MRKALTTGILASTLGGCGWYTNIPAQILVKSISPASVEYSTTSSGGSSTTNAKVTQPVVTLEGEPGSIGATYTLVTIKYRDVSSKNALIAGINGGNAVDSSATIRVESSALRSNLNNGTQDMIGLDPNASLTQKQPLIIGTAQWTAPIITQDVIAFGKPSGGSAPGQIYAEVLLDGIDDAHFPAHQDLNIPITFVNDNP